ncbi:MAG: hypothetical protein H0U49_04290 [Parachlamydiaceae bacterium]|nr:hypothetical protein [Parachlamydiaceae bacterium]
MRKNTVLITLRASQYKSSCHQYPEFCLHGLYFGHSKLGIGMPSYVVGTLLSLGRDKQNVVQHVAWHSNAEFGRDMSNLLLTTYPNSVCTAFTLAGIPSYVLVTIII